LSGAGAGWINSVGVRGIKRAVLSLFALSF
jgi:hypothetical protein